MLVAIPEIARIRYKHSSLHSDWQSRIQIAIQRLISFLIIFYNLQFVSEIMYIYMTVVCTARHLWFVKMWVASTEGVAFCCKEVDVF
jgi:hypothetical protein